jgi:16S rRNA processing protein RimM
MVGKIARPHGVRGEIGMKLLTDHPERLLSVEMLYVGGDYQPHRVRRMRRHLDGMIIHFADVGDRNAAEMMRDRAVYIHVSDAVPLEDGEVYLYQIEGIRVVTDVGEELGKLTDLIETGANDVYVITGEDGGELLLPAIPEVILKIDVPSGVMIVRLLEGLR